MNLFEFPRFPSAKVIFVDPPANEDVENNETPLRDRILAFPTTGLLQPPELDNNNHDEKLVYKFGEDVQVQCYGSRTHTEFLADAWRMVVGSFVWLLVFTGCLLMSIFLLHRNPWMIAVSTILMAFALTKAMVYLDLHEKIPASLDFVHEFGRSRKRVVNSLLKKGGFSRDHLSGMAEFFSHRERVLLFARFDKINGKILLTD